MLVALHECVVTILGFTRVQLPVEVLAGEAQKLSAFSHRTTPAQLSVNVLPVIARVPPYGPGTRLSAPDSEMYTAGSGNPPTFGPATTALWTKVLLASRKL